MTLLILRPQPGAEATAQAAAALGRAAVIAPLFAVQAMAWAAPDPAGFDALLLTSANAVRHAGPALASYRHLPAYTVGEATAAAARAARLTVAHAGAGDGPALAAFAEAGGVRHALHLAGRVHRPLGAGRGGEMRDAASAGASAGGPVHAAGDPVALADANERLRVTTVPVYDAMALAVLPQAARAALGQGAVALLHSPRAAGLFRMLVEQARIAPGNVRITAISARALGAAGTGWAGVAVAAHPADDALLAAAIALCDQGRGRDK